MSRVFLADDLALKRSVVIKVLHPEFAAGVNAERFNREVLLSARLQHPHIVPVLTAGAIDGLPYYIMPFVRGSALRARIAQGPLPIPEVLGILGDVAKALGFAHEEGIVHRDIKPGNILLSGGAATVADFGIAKALSSARHESAGGSLTTLGMSIGTPEYMAPEQVAGDPDVDHRADIYSLGCVAYAMLAGQSPFAGKSPQQMLAAQVMAKPVPIEQRRRDVPPALAALVMRCLEKEASQRPQSAAEIAWPADATDTFAVVTPEKGKYTTWVLDRGGRRVRDRGHRCSRMLSATRRPYYGDSYTWQFDATVVEASSHASEPIAILDASYFYPTSGGQPHDTGTLGSTKVVDVRVRESDGAIIHVLDAPIEAGALPAVIDGVRRFDHMQQHTGQHILSQAFLRVANAATIGFHLGVESVSIDLDASALSDAAISNAADVANQLVSANVDVRAWFPSAAELTSLALRKMPDVDGPVRVVAIGDFDFSACGGTHVARSGEVGLLSVLRTERMKRGMRVEFLAGHRARADYARKHATIRELSATLTCAPAEIVDAVAKLSGAVIESRRALAMYRERDLDEEAVRLGANARDAGSLKIVRSSWGDRSIDDVKGLALRLTSDPSVVVLFGVTGSRTQLIFARSENVVADLKPAFERALATFGGGKGGGGRVLMGSAASVDAAVLASALEAAETELG
jgi:serine/threonine protein kinase